MRIDWITLVAQLVNFAILVLLLKRFLYGRIIAAIDRREKSIAERIESADRSRAEAEEQEAALRSARKELEGRAASLLSDAEKEAHERLESLTREARNDVARAQEKWRRSVERQRKAFLTQLRSRAGQQIYETTRTALQDLADASLERQAIVVFERELDALSDEDRQALASAADRGGAVLRSAFPIPAARTQKLEKRVRSLIGDAPLRFESSDELIFGLELVAGDRSISWSARGYVDRLEQGIAQLLEREARLPSGARNGDTPGPGAAADSK